MWDAWNAVLAEPLWGGGKSDSDGAEPGRPGRARKRAPILRKLGNAGVPPAVFGIMPNTLLQLPLET